MYQHIKIPSDGERIQVNENNSLNVPDNPILFGITFAILIVILGIRTIETKKNIYINLVAIIISLFLLLRSGSRGAVASLAACIIFYLLFLSKIKLKSKILYISIFSLFSILIVYILPSQVTDFYAYTFSDEAQISEASSVYQRITMWDQATNEFLQNPVTGVGMGNSVGGSGFPHNIILEILAEFGIIGFVFLVLLLNIVIRHAFIVSKGSNKNALYMRIALVLFIYNSIEGLFSGFLGNQTTIYMGIGMIESLYVINKGRNE